MTLAGSFGGLAIGYNTGVVAPAMLFMDEIFPEITSIGKAVRFKLYKSCVVICKLRYSCRNSGSSHFRFPSREIREKILDSNLWLVSTWWSVSAQHFFRPHDAQYGPFAHRSRFWYLNDLGTSLPSRVGTGGPQRADSANLFLPAFLRPYSFILLGPSLPKLASLYVRYGHHPTRTPISTDGFHSEWTASVPRSVR